jgi:salicylate biosynthesis isochorismate synthase/menaquinone-specific isochorismate synthase
MLSEMRDLISSTDSEGLAAVTVPVSPDLDPSAVVIGSRRARDRWSCWEQPDRSGFSLATLGQVREVISRGEERFEEVERDANEIISSIKRRGDEGLPQGAGPVFVGGFAFDPEGCSTPEWSSLPPALLVLPEIAIQRFENSAWLTAVVDLSGGSEAALNGLDARLGAIREASMPQGVPGLQDERPAEIVEGYAEWGPADYEQAVAKATEEIRGGAFEKVVLARSLHLERQSAYEPALVLGALRQAFPSCFCFAVGTPELTFCGASPELLVRRSGPLAATVALAGSVRRSADPAVDDHLGESLLRSDKDRFEHEIVVQRIRRGLAPISVWVECDDEPSLARISNIQHLATPIRAQLAEAMSVTSLASLLHPTPAVGGEPSSEALDAISRIEGMDRGWYAGPVGWMDFTGDGEFCVALRSALLRDRAATLFAGAGIVADSDPSGELAETELKLDALLPLLS